MCARAGDAGPISDAASLLVPSRRHARGLYNLEWIAQGVAPDSMESFRVLQLGPRFDPSTLFRREIAGVRAYGAFDRDRIASGLPYPQQGALLS